jgi:integrase
LTVLPAWADGPHGDLDVAVAVPGYLSHAESLVEGLGPAVDSEHVKDKVLAFLPGPVRKVPIPPELVELLRAHVATFGVAPDGRLFRSERGNPLQPSTWWQVWQKVRATSLTPEQLASPLMKRPYDLRHSGVTWRLNSGVPATEVAAWAGHSVEILTRVYTRCVVGLEDVWIGRMDQTLHLEEDR